jgi:hypothetical protein
MAQAANAPRLEKFPLREKSGNLTEDDNGDFNQVNPRRFAPAQITPPVVALVVLRQSAKDKSSNDDDASHLLWSDRRAVVRGEGISGLRRGNKKSRCR